MSAAEETRLRPIDWEWITERRRKLLEVEDPALQRRRSFFCALEFATSSLLTPFVPSLSVAQRAHRNAIVKATVGFLVRRLHRRLRLPSPSQDPELSAQRRALQLPIAELSRLQIGNLHAHVANHDGQLDIDEIDSMFFAFANGALRLGPDGSTPGRGPADPYMTLDAEPSGDFFFLFAEFAFSAIEESIEPATWQRLLPGLVASQEVLIRAYAPPPGQRRLGQYSSSHFERNFENRMTADEMDSVRSRYRQLSFRDLDTRATMNARRAYCDGVEAVTS